MSTVVGGFKRRQPKSKKSKHAVKKYEPKVFENPKSALFLRGQQTNNEVVDTMKDIATIMKPNCKKLAKRNAFHAFEGREHLEFLGFKNDCSLFCFASHSKKRPMNLVFGRMYDFSILDMMEVGLLAADSIDMSGVKGTSAGSLGGKPCFVFEGSEFENEPFFIRLRNFLLDYFRGTSESATRLVNMSGVDRVVFVTLRSKNGGDAVVPPSSDCLGSAKPKEAGNTVVCFRHYALVKPDTVTDKSQIKLVDIGPNIDMEIRRVFFASDSDFKKACRQPREVQAYAKSLHDNIKTDSMGNLRGQIHMGKQDVKGLALRRFKSHVVGKKREREERGEQEEQEGVETVAPVSKSRKVETVGTIADRKKRPRKSGGGTVGAPDVDI